MSESHGGPAQPSDLPRRRLTDLRNSLLRLHKVLLDSERASYEDVYGRIASNGQFLQLLMQDEWFDWLRRVSGLLVEIDERLDAEEPVTAIDARRLMVQTRGLLRASEEGTHFEKRYDEALQRDPAVVLAHGEVARLLASEL